MVGNSKTEQLRQEVLRQFQNLKELTPDERRELLYKLSPRGLRPNPPKIKYVEGANIENLPPKLKAIFERAKQDPEFLNAIISVLKEGMNMIFAHAQDQQSFCNLFIYPTTTAKKLIKIFGISESELKEEMSKIGFYQGNRNYAEPYYLVLTLTYGIGVYVDNTPIRIMSLLMVSVRYWNANVKKFFRLGCDHEYAKYAIQYLAKNNVIFKKYHTPIAFLTKFFIIDMDAFLPVYLRQDIANPKTGLRKVLTAIQPRIAQYFSGVFRKHYYDAYHKGLKVTSADAYTSAYDNKNEMIEAKETIQNNIDKILDKFKKNRLLTKNILKRPDVVNYLRSKRSVTVPTLEKIENWIRNNPEDMEMIVEFLLQGIKPKGEDEICQLDVSAEMKKIGNSKKNEYFINFNKYKNQVTEKLFGDKKAQLGAQSWYRLQKIVGDTLFIYFKATVCKSV